MRLRLHQRQRGRLQRFDEAGRQADGDAVAGQLDDAFKRYLSSFPLPNRNTATNAMDVEEVEF